MKTISASLEDYLEIIYKIIQEKQTVKSVEVSKRLGVGRSSVSDALRNLADKNLVNYERYGTISLTEEGKQEAQRVELKHKVLYEFLNTILGINPKEAEENACRIEHVISDNLLNRLIAFIEFNKNNKNENYLCEFNKFYKNK